MVTLKSDSFSKRYFACLPAMNPDPAMPDIVLTTAKETKAAKNIGCPDTNERRGDQRGNPAAAMTATTVDARAA